MAGSHFTIDHVKYVDSTHLDVRFVGTLPYLLSGLTAIGTTVPWSMVGHSITAIASTADPKIVRLTVSPALVPTTAYSLVFTPTGGADDPTAAGATPTPNNLLVLYILTFDSLLVIDATHIKAIFSQPISSVGTAASWEVYQDFGPFADLAPPFLSMVIQGDAHEVIVELSAPLTDAQPHGFFIDVSAAVVSAGYTWEGGFIEFTPALSEWEVAIAALSTSTFALSVTAGGPGACADDTLLGWGSGPWGSTPWGGAEITDPCLFISRVDAVRENVIRITFSKPIYFTNYGDVPDGSTVRKYLVSKVVGTIGLDGAPVRDVLPLEISLADVESNDGSMVDIFLDRPMTPFPAVYHVEVFDIFNASASAKIDPLRSGSDVFAVYREIEPPSVEALVPARDFANPSTLSGALDPLPDPTSGENLGTIPVDDTGDYAFDEGVQSFKKRVFRRLTTRKNGFAHLPGYGVGILEVGKKLGTSSIRQEKCSESEKQIAQEPETEAVRVTIVPMPDHPEMFRLAVVVKMRGLSKATKFEMGVPAA